MIEMEQLPVFPHPKVRDVAEVVAGVPGVDEGGVLDGHGAILGVVEAALPLGVVEGLEEHDPASVQAFDEFQGPLCGGGGVVERGPSGLIVGFDGGPVLGEGEADADESVHVAVGDVVDELADCPAALAIGRGPLGAVEAVDGVAELAGHLRESGDGFEDVLGGDTLRRDEFADGVAWIGVDDVFNGHKDAGPLKPDLNTDRIGDSASQYQ